MDKCYSNALVFCEKLIFDHLVFHLIFFSKCCGTHLRELLFCVRNELPKQKGNSEVNEERRKKVGKQKLVTLVY